MIVSFEEYEQKRKDVNIYHKKMCKVIDKFISSNDNFMKKHNIYAKGYGYYGCTDFYIDSQKRNDFIVKYYCTSGGMGTDEIYFSHKEYLELLDYMKNIELYDDAKKFNL